MPRTQDAESGSDGCMGSMRSHGEGMDAQSRATQEQSPNAKSVGVCAEMLYLDVRAGAGFSSARTDLHNKNRKGA